MDYEFVVGVGDYEVYDGLSKFCFIIRMVCKKKVVNKIVFVNFIILFDFLFNVFYVKVVSYIFLMEIGYENYNWWFIDKYVFLVVELKFWG